MKDIIEKYKDVVVQIATPFSTGTGFYIKEHNLIVTNEHVVRDSKEVAIDGNAFDKTTSNVLFSDPHHDIAFLSPPKGTDFKDIKLTPDPISDGDKVIAIGHPMGLKYTFTQGIVSNATRLMQEKDLNYIQTDAAINPGNSGGPLVNESGDVVGINTMIFNNSNNLGFALDVQYLKTALTEYTENYGKVASRCKSCSNIVYEDNVDAGYCPHCGSKIKLPSDLDDYEPTGVAKTLETIITDAGHDVKLSRRGPSHWQIENGSAKVQISYYPKSGYIMVDSFLAKLPKKNIASIYEFLLRENDKLEGMTFSVYHQDVVLSLVIYDRYLNLESGKTLITSLFDKSDHYDDILVDTYGAIWKTEED